MPLSSFVIEILNYFQLTPNQYTLYFWLVLRIPEDINSSKNVPLRLEEILSYFQAKPIDANETWWMIYKKRNLPWIFNLLNKTKDEKLFSVEVGGN